MRFRQIDQITRLEPGESIEAFKYLDGGEDYLRDHFPRFAVMPGVLMLESLYQAATYLVRASEDFRPGLVMLKAAKNVKFADFVEPGQRLKIDVQVVKKNGNQYIVKGTGSKDGVTAVSGRLVIECVESDEPDIVDKHTSLYMKQMAEQLQQATMACE